LYFLGSGNVGKTTLCQSLKEQNLLINNIARLMGFSRKSSKKVEKTKGLENSLVSTEGIHIQIFDVGGQHHYHHQWHFALEDSRSIFLIVSNPRDSGYQESVLYFLRLLCLKRFKTIPKVLFVFSRRDNDVDPNTIFLPSNQIISEVGLKDQVEKWKSTFNGYIHVLDYIWMDCRSSNSKELNRLWVLLQDQIKLFPPLQLTRTLRTTLETILRTIRKSDQIHIFSKEDLLKTISNLTSSDYAFWKSEAPIQMGRRFLVESLLHMFPPQILPQIICETQQKFSSLTNPFIWPEGVAFVKGKCHIIITLYDARVENYFEDLQSKIVRRDYKDFKLLNKLDILLCGPNNHEVQASLEEIESCINTVRDKFWQDLSFFSYDIDLSGKISFSSSFFFKLYNV